MPKYFSDDARLEAVKVLDINKSWSEQAKGAHQQALDKWHEICASWYREHKERADSEEGKASALKELKKAFAYLRRESQQKPSPKKQRTKKTPQSKFRVGDRVQHDHGIGEILELKEKTALVNFEDHYLPDDGSCNSVTIYKEKWVRQSLLELYNE